MVSLHTGDSVERRAQTRSAKDQQEEAKSTGKTRKVKQAL